MASQCSATTYIIAVSDSNFINMNNRTNITYTKDNRIKPTLTKFKFLASKLRSASNNVSKFEISTSQH